MENLSTDGDGSCETAVNVYHLYHNHNNDSHAIFSPGSSFHAIDMEKNNLDNDILVQFLPTEEIVNPPEVEDFSSGSMTETCAFMIDRRVQNGVSSDNHSKNLLIDTDSLLNNREIENNEINLDEKSEELPCTYEVLKEDIIKTNSTSREESKHSDSTLEPKPNLASFLTMENSSNAIDNNFHNEINGENSIPIVVPGGNYAVNHVFKLPKSDLTFNGTLKRLKNLNPQTEIDFSNDKSEFDVYKEITNNSEIENREVFKPIVHPEDDQENIDTNQESSNTTDILSPKETDNRLVNNLSPKDNDSMIKDINKETSDNSFDTMLHSPELFSYEEDISEPICMKLRFIMKQFEKSDNGIIKKLEKTLQGVLPPPSVTISQLTATEILDLYNKNLSAFNNGKIQNSEENPYDSEISNHTNAASTPPRPFEDFSSELMMTESFGNAFDNTITQTFNANATTTETINKSYEPSKNFYGFLNFNSDEEMAKNTPWPQILHCRYYGIHYNATTHSEHVDCLLSKYTSRFVGCETASSCVAIHNNNSSQLRRNIKSAGYSPGRRLSHLARRRTAFCSAMSLQESINQMTKRQILIDKNFFPHRKFSNVSCRTRWKSPRGKRTPGRRTPGRKTPGKKTPSSSQKKRAIRRSQVATEQPTRETSKRALFMSPDDNVDDCKPSTSRAVKSKRALFGSPKDSNSSLNGTEGSGSRKRERSDDDMFGFSCLKTKMQKSFSFSGDQRKDSFSINTPQSLTRRASECLTSKGELSDIHRKKLIWAVAEALRGYKIVPASEDFKQHASSLVRLVRKLCILPHNAQALRTPMTSTSETLLRIAKQHVFAVIRGKSVDDIFKEEQCKHTTFVLSKVSGYIPPSSTMDGVKTELNKNSENAYGEIKSSTKIEHPQMSGTAKSVLQDKTVNIDTKSNGSSNTLDIHVQKKNALSKDSAILRARRQISFDNIDDPSSR